MTTNNQQTWTTGWCVLFGPLALYTPDVFIAILQLVAGITGVLRQIAVSPAVEPHSSVLDITRLRDTRSCRQK